MQAINNKDVDKLQQLASDGSTLSSKCHSIDSNALISDYYKKLEADKDREKELLQKAREQIQALKGKYGDRWVSVDLQLDDSNGWIQH